MCGIAAIFAYGESAQPVDRDEVLRTRDYMASRGPDGAGEWFSDDGRVGLGHRRLSIIDLSPTGAQPMFSADGSLAIIFNGEIYNYRELRTKLEQSGRRFVSQSDTEVLLHLYAEHGDAMLENVRGMYAFAIWDRQRQCLFLARDPFGIKPLYYADDGKTIRVASQVKALRECGKIDLAPDPAGHVGFFLWGHVPDPYTMFRNIRSLPAGSTMRIDRTGARAPREFCSITSILREGEESEIRNSKVESRNSNPQSAIRNPDYQQSTLNSQPAELLRSALTETVRYHLVADVPVGVFLSSGLDSTTIAALAAEQGGILRTVTLGFEEYKGTNADETPLAEQFAKRCGAQHQTIWVSRADFEAERDHLFEAMDRPTIDGVNTFFVSLAAKQADLKVVLSGLGGDELFASYPSFQDIPSMVRLLRPLRPLLPTFGREIRFISAPILKRLTSPKYAGMFEYGGTYSGAYLLRRGLFMPWELPELLDPEMVRDGWRELQTLLQLDETLDGIRNPRLKVSALEMNWYMRHQLLRDSDWAGMGHSVEIRVPFVDVDLLRAIGPLLAGKHPPTKRDMAASASGLITPEILNRRKTGFQIPVRDWLISESKYAKFQQHQSSHRGLRGWAREVYSHFIPDRNVSRLHTTGRRARSASVNKRTGEKLRIMMLLSDGFGGFGGIAKFNRDFLGALSSSATVEKVVAIPRLMQQDPGPLPPKIAYVTAALGGKQPFMWATVRAARELRASKVHRVPPVIICAHINLLAAALVARRITRGRLYLIVHGVDAWQPTRDPIANACVRRIDDFISVSSITRRRFLQWSGLRQDLGVVLPNCVDLSAFTPGEKSRDLLSRYGLENRTVILTVGRLDSEERYKGFDEVMEIVPRLAKAIPNITYMIVGDGPDRPRLEEKARSLGVAGRVIFTGYISEAEKVDHYRLADAYVMPSSGEGFGIVYLEALGCGIPVIGSKTDGSRDALRDGKLGVVVNPTNPAEIEAAVLNVLNHRGEDRPLIGLNGDDTIEYFSQARFEDRVHKMIDAIAA
jgi:asparagine synthase (glutamine-hydrolysing)